MASISNPSEEQTYRLLTDIKDYQLTHGSLIKWVRREGPTRVPSVGVSVSALPTPFPRRFFDEAWQLQELMNELYIRVASDEEWLYDVLEPLLKDDEFLRALWDVHVKVKEAGMVQEVVCGIFRSDYMLHQPVPGESSMSLKQVEINTTCVAGACHAERVASMHRHLRRVRDARKPPEERAFNKLPVNNNIAQLVATLKLAHGAYIGNDEPMLSDRRSCCILMIVQPRNFNIADERPIEYGLWDSDIPCYRCEWQEVLQRTTLTSDRTLLFRVKDEDALAEMTEVSVIYYRAGYQADEYLSEQGRDVRLRLELSRAIKCPDVLTHLSTFKAVQQALTEEGAVERFLGAAENGGAKRIRETFMPMLKASDSSKAGQLQQRQRFRDIATNPTQAAHYVLKPNLEGGGGHNVYGSDIVPHLSNITEEQWSRYILMRKIVPPEESKGVLLMVESLYSGVVVSELGVLGGVVWRKQKKEKGGDGREGAVGAEVDILRNGVAGWTFKTKPAGVDEMNVVKGHGCFDCPELVG